MMRDLFKKKQKKDDAQERVDAAMREIQAALVRYNVAILPVITLGPNGVVDAGIRITAKEDSP